MGLHGFSWFGLTEIGWDWIELDGIWLDEIDWMIWMRMDEIRWDWMRLDEIGWDWMKLDEIGWNWMKLDEMGWNGMKWDETGWNGMKRDETGWNGMKLVDYIKFSRRWYCKREE